MKYVIRKRCAQKITGREGVRPLCVSFFVWV